MGGHGWGALRLCCRNPSGSFSCYLTRLHGGGRAGTCWSEDARLLQAVGPTPEASASARPLTFRFANACSARLVIRVRDRPLGGGQMFPAYSGEGRRLAAI